MTIIVGAAFSGGVVLCADSSGLLASGYETKLFRHPNGGLFGVAGEPIVSDLLNNKSMNIVDLILRQDSLAPESIQAALDIYADFVAAAFANSPHDSFKEVIAEILLPLEAGNEFLIGQADITARFRNVRCYSYECSSIFAGIGVWNDFAVAAGHPEMSLPIRLSFPSSPFGNEEAAADWCRDAVLAACEWSCACSAPALVETMRHRVGDH